jgi:DNA-binding transcriptional ArsR family regulator
MSAGFDRTKADAMAERLRALAQPQRLMILAILLDGELSVGQIEAAAAIGQPALSQQLAELRRTGLVATRRETRQIYYRLANEDAEERVRSIFDAFGAARPVPGARASGVMTKPRLGPVGAASFVRIG